jgi:hypothetical protein
VTDRCRECRAEDDGSGRCPKCGAKRPVPAVITESGDQIREPYARIQSGRHAGKVFPMGWNKGKTYPVGTVGTAVYESTSYAGLWAFTPKREGSNA